MTKKEELTLILKVIDGDSQAILEFANQGIKLSSSVASKYHKKFTQNAFYGWNRAFNEYIKNKNYEKDYKFSAYATYFMKKEVESNYIK